MATIYVNEGYIGQYMLYPGVSAAEGTGVNVGTGVGVRVGVGVPTFTTGNRNT